MNGNDYDEIVEILEKRFSDVPNISEGDAEVWVDSSLIEHGIRKGSRIPPELIPLILLYAEAEGASRVAMKTAHYFEFTDKDESIDKSDISENFRKIAEDLWKRYRLKKDEGVEGFGGPVMKFMRRVDRP